MIYLVAVLIGASVAGITVLLAQMAPSRPAAVGRRLAELEQLGTTAFSPERRNARRAQRQRFEGLLRFLSDRMGEERKAAPEVRQMLVHAGFRSPAAPGMYTAARIFLPLGMMGFGVMLSPVAGARGLALGVLMAMFGWIAPAFYVGGKMKRRQKDLQKALPDALDSLVVCVEAGLGLNQAMVRVSEEVRHISTLMADELVLTNMEVRAGTPREDALRNLAERTGVNDIRSLVTMLIQTDRFGTSIAQALRVQSDTLREKRKQRAEEAAAKTSIKMLFPLIFLIFPAMFAITLGPAIIQLLENWKTPF